MKGYAKIAYWDTEQGAAPPPLLGEIRGTPTIRLYKPKRKQKQAGSNKEKQVVDYNGERKAKDMKKFIDYYMPNFAEQIVNGPKDLDKFEGKAAKHGLPKAMLFVSKAETIPLTKFLTTEFRRKLLIAEVKPTKKNKEIMDKYGVVDLPALVVFPLASEEGEEASDAPEFVRYEGEGFSKNKLHSFLSKYALKKMVVPKKKTEATGDSETKPANEEKQDNHKVKEEL